MKQFFYSCKCAFEKRSFLTFFFFLNFWLIFHLLKDFIEFPKFFDSYFDDFLVVPIVLTFSLFLQQLWVNPLLIFSKWQVVSVIIYFGILFEFILPKFMEAYTSDLFDIIAYLLGGITFYFIQKVFIKK